ncbi:MAG TPA: phosphoglucosamine mutase [Gemmatimonadales bacterium]|nr:phosphoglucosamine mutase [Gemmatimonadales bacterium]
MTDTLMVGVSGVRGIVGKDLTEDVVARYGAAFGQWAKGGARRPLVVVGRDARESGPAFERAVTEGLASAGCAVVTVGVAPTPTIQLAVEHHGAGGGIAITASHNPIEWNALKFIGPDGIFLDGADGKRVQELAAKDGGGRGKTGEVTTDGGAIERHLAAVLRLAAVDVEAIRKRGFLVALDAVRGAGGPTMRTLLERLGCRVTGINLETDGRFPHAPEPVPENLGDLAGLVRRAGADVGIAVDPDVDRLAIVDETGVPIGEDYTLAFAVRAVMGGGRSDSRTVGPRRGSPSDRPTVRPSVVCNLSTSLVVEDAARDCGAEVVRTPVGEAHVARAIVRLGAVIGGEGNGGVVYPALHVGRDAPVAAGLLLTLLAREGRRVSQLVAAAPRYVIVKAKVARGPALEPAYAALRRRFADAEVDTQDGLRLAWPNRWLHVRPSNTEPIIRLIAEAPSDAEARQLVDQGRRLCAASITA